MLYQFIETTIYNFEANSLDEALSKLEHKQDKGEVESLYCIDENNDLVYRENESGIER